MPLLGQAAMLLSFDIAPDAICEHDDWHTHEHLPERLSIPGFLRGSRWAAIQGQPRYLVLYEVENVGTLESDAYLQRLNNPTPWTSKIMPNYRGMVRGLCSVVASYGVGMGHFGLLIRFEPAAGAKPALDPWLGHEVLPRLPTQPGLGGAHLLEAAATPRMTTEQRIRGADAGVRTAIVVTGYSPARLEDLAEGVLSSAHLEAHGAQRVTTAIYQAEYTLTAPEVEAWSGRPGLLPPGAHITHHA
jgi:hypothetical protein